MSKNRWISDHFWSDTYIENLDPVEKLIFLYFLSNDQTSLCGIYEISLKRISMQTGIEQSMVVKILERFHNDGKISYISNYIIVWNFKKHQSLNPNMRAGLDREFNELPEHIKETFTKGFQSLSKDSKGISTLLYFTLPNSTSPYAKNAEKDFDVLEMKDLWKNYAGTTLRNHVEENLKDYNYLKKELGEDLKNYLQAIRMIRADQYQKRTLQAKLINYSGLRDKLEEVESYMTAQTDKKIIRNNQVNNIPGRKK